MPKKAVLNDINNEKAAYEKALAELEAASREIEALIRRSQSGDQLGTGGFYLACPGLYPYHNLALRDALPSHTQNLQKIHTGMDIGAPYGRQNSCG